MLRKSEFLRIIRLSEDENLAYHSLFGNLRTLNKSAVDILNLFAQPRPAAGPELERHGAFIAEAQDLYFLKDGRADERQTANRLLEDRRAALKTGAQIGGLQLSISDACNFKCVYCFADSTDRRSPARIRAAANPVKLMPFDTAKAVIEAVLEVVRRNAGDSLVVKFFGREPMLNWQTIKRVCDTFKRRSRGVDIHYSMTTNGSLIDDEVAATLKSYEFQVTVSVDGVEKANDVNRPLAGGRGSFSMINDSLANLLRHGVNFDFSGVISNNNFDTLDDRFVDLAAAFGVAEIKLLLAMQGGLLATDNVEPIIEKITGLYAYAKAAGIAVTGYWYNPFSQLITASKRRRETKMTRPVQESCAATGFQLSVEPSGDVFPCRAMSTYFGHISKLDSLLESKAYEQVVQRTYANVPDCRGCEIEGFCQGECLGNCEERFGDIYRVDKRFCTIYKRLVEELLRLEASRPPAREAAAPASLSAVN